MPHLSSLVLHAPVAVRLYPVQWMEAGGEGEPLMLRGVALVALVLACLGIAGDDTPRLRFWHPPSFLTAGDAIDLQLRIPAHDDNRLVTLDAFDGGESVLHSQRDLDGASAPLQVFPKLLLPKGDLLLVGQLWGLHGSLARVTHPLVVRGRAGDD